MNKMKRVAVLAGTASAVGTLLAAPASAAQEGDPFVCRTGNICVWQDGNFNGGMQQFDQLVVLNYYGQFYDNGEHINDTVSSIFNRSSHRINFYWNAGAHLGDLCIRVDPGTSIGNLGSYGCDNTLSSHYSADL
ncbi:MAG TPA: peptidase inhibitor family I36 protein [Vicinamibacterales bacterium]|jgi:hypothetical protein|nr:peptidase inhibitor family I36 protein [Vicinamibacterales bacterium]